MHEPGNYYAALRSSLPVSALTKSLIPLLNCRQAASWYIDQRFRLSVSASRSRFEVNAPPNCGDLGGAISSAKRHGARERRLPEADAPELGVV